MVPGDEIYRRERQLEKKRKMKEEERARRHDRFFVQSDVKKKEKRESFAEGLKAGESVGDFEKEDLSEDLMETEFEKSERMFDREPELLSAQEYLSAVAEADEESASRKLNERIQNQQKEKAELSQEAERQAARKNPEAEEGVLAMREMASGQTPGFHKMMNSMSAYLEADGENGKEKQHLKKEAAKDIAEFVIKDCAPQNVGADPKAFRTAMYSLKSILPKEGFEQFVGQLNQQPGRGVKYKASDFDRLPEKEASKAENGLEAPVLKPANDWEN